jgi:hypothetical protein
VVSRARTKLDCGELIHVERWISEDLPGAFMWRGSRHVVRRVQDKLAAGSQEKEMHEGCRRIALCTTNGMRCVLSHNRERGIWTIEHVTMRNQGGRDGNRHAMV